MTLKKRDNVVISNQTTTEGERGGGGKDNRGSKRKPIFLLELGKQ